MGNESWLYPSRPEHIYGPTVPWGMKPREPYEEEWMCSQFIVEGNGY